MLPLVPPLAALLGSGTQENAVAPSTRMALRPALLYVAGVLPSFKFDRRKCANAQCTVADGMMSSRDLVRLAMNAECDSSIAARS